MKHPTILLTIGLLSISAMCSHASLTKKAIEKKSDSELINLLTNGESSVRSIAIMVLGLRYDDPQAPVILSPLSVQATRPKDVALPNGLLEKTANLAKEDSDLKVRLAAIRALSSFRCRTNTTQILTMLLEDRVCIIKIRAAQALIGFATNYRETVSDKVVQTLIDCVSPNNSTDDIWQAAEALGQLGARAKDSLPFLVKLDQHQSEQVREYTKAAVIRIQTEVERESSKP